MAGNGGAEASSSGQHNKLAKPRRRGKGSSATLQILVRLVNGYTEMAQSHCKQCSTSSSNTCISHAHQMIITRPSEPAGPSA